MSNLHRYSIGKVARRAGVGVETIRFHDAKNCLQPEPVKIRATGFIQRTFLAKSTEVALDPSVAKLPSPIRKIIGNLSNTERVFIGLYLRPRGTDPLAIGKGQKHGG
jgi:hypothetical protein